MARSVRDSEAFGRDATRERTPAQLFALIFGSVYLLVGIVGFFVTGFDNFAEKDPAKIVVFSVNPLHNVVHILIGAVWIAASRTAAAARAANLGIGIAYLALAIIGLLELNTLGFLANNTADNWLHLVTGLLAVLFGTRAAERTRTADRTRL
ncbi:MAG: DUF4383 domain-containing protein [Actinomycetota bacterium]|nr:DUF4383 domain-containing protein [Actinomycetota bacterium]